MSAAIVETRVPRHVSNYHGGPERSFSPHRRGRSSTGGLLERINAAEVRSIRPRSHSRSLVLREPHHHHHHHHRSVDEINAEIRALEAESRANHLERKAERERELAEEIREYSPSPERPERIILDERRHHGRPKEEVLLYERSRSRPREEVFYERSRPRDELVVYERSRSRVRDDYVVYERRKSPQRNVVRVEKDRKGRLALVRSAH